MSKGFQLHFLIVSVSLTLQKMPCYTHELNVNFKKVCIRTCNNTVSSIRTFDSLDKH